MTKKSRSGHAPSCPRHCAPSDDALKENFLKSIGHASSGPRHCAPSDDALKENILKSIGHAPSGPRHLRAGRRNETIRVRAGIPERPVVSPLRRRRRSRKGASEMDSLQRLLN
jgi:hypothetical protein